MVSYSVDFMLSFYYNQIKRAEGGPVSLTGLILSSSKTATHIVPVVDGTTITHLSKRIPLGGEDHHTLLS